MNQYQVKFEIFGRIIKTSIDAKNEADVKAFIKKAININCIKERHPIKIDTEGVVIALNQINKEFGVNVRVQCKDPINQLARQKAVIILKEKFNLPLKAIAPELNIASPSGVHNIFEKAKRNRVKLFS